jgi:glycosyltransferase involved in cell wall biosynthesis
VPGTQLWLAGDGPERERIADLISREKITGIKMLGTREDIPRLLAASDAVLLSSVSEGIPLSLIEAMAARRPVVSTEVGSVAEIVVAEETGLLVSARQPERLAEAMLRLVKNPLLCRRLGDRGRVRAEHLFSESLMMNRYAMLYREMVR